MGRQAQASQGPEEEERRRRRGRCRRKSPPLLRKAHTHTRGTENPDLTPRLCLERTTPLCKQFKVTTIRLSLWDTGPGSKKRETNPFVSPPRSDPAKTLSSTHGDDHHHDRRPSRKPKPPSSRRCRPRHRRAVPCSEAVSPRSVRASTPAKWLSRARSAARGDDTAQRDFHGR